MENVAKLKVYLYLVIGTNTQEKVLKEYEKHYRSVFPNSQISLVTVLQLIQAMAQPTEMKTNMY